MHLLLDLNEARAAQARGIADTQPIHVRFDFHGVAVNVSTNSRYLAEHLRVGYHFFEVAGGGAPDVSLLALEAGKAGHLEGVRRLLPGRKCPDHLVIPLEMGLIFVLRDRSLFAYYTVIPLFGQVIGALQRRFTCLHAATVARNGHGLILCGAARCGKSVLTALLLEQGFRYTSDDVTLIARNTLRVAPFPRAINIRQDCVGLAAPLLARARQMRRFSIADQERLLVDLGEPVPDEVAPSALCFPTYGSDAPANVERLGPAVAVACAMRHRFVPVGARSNGAAEEDFDTLAQLIETTACYRLAFSDPIAAAGVLRTLL